MTLEAGSESLPFLLCLLPFYLREWLSRLAGVVRPRRRDADLEEELRLHLELAEADARRRGLPPDAAARAARLHEGASAQAMDALRDQRGIRWLDDVARDVRHGLRSLARTPVFTAAALATLALGIGANTAIFSILHGLLLTPLGYSRPEQLVLVSSHFPFGGSARTLSYPEYEELRALTRAFSAIGAFTVGGANTGGGSGSWAGEVNLTADGRPMRVRSAAVDEHLLATLGVQPLQGRLFQPGETDAMPDRPGLGGHPIAILSYELWQRAFAGRPIVGTHVDVDGRPHAILGVMPPGIDLMDRHVDIWLPLGVHPATRRIRTSHVLQVIGRLKDDVSIEAANAELAGVLDRWTGDPGHVPTSQPAGAGDHTLRLQTLHAAIVGDAGRGVWLLQAAVLVVLLIVCANLANLVLARSESRRREFAVRAALGAGHGRLLRQLLTESLLIAIAGGALAVWLASLGLAVVARTWPASLPRTREIGLDLPVLLVAVAVSLAAAVLLGLAPAAQRRARDLVQALRSGGDRSDRGPGRRRVRHALVAAQVALAVMLVAGAGVLLRTIWNLAAVDAGFDRSRLVTFSMTLPRATDYDGGRALVYQRLLAALRASPGIDAATAMTDLPFERHVQGYPTRIESDAAATGQQTETVDYYQFVMSDYFETMRIPIVAGRGFSPADAVSESRVAIVNETLARRLWQDRDPIGRRVRPNLSASMGTMANPWHTVIGIAGDVKEGGVDRETGTELYLFAEQPAPPIDGTSRPWRRHAAPTMHVAVRTSEAPAALAPMLERAVRELDPGVPIVRLREMEDVFAASIRRPRLLGQLLGLFAGLALALVAVGTYGVLACLVAERQREIGIRLALGASRAGVVAQVLAQGLRLALAGVVIGLAGALAAGQLLAAFLFGVGATDPLTLTAVTVVVVSVSAVASAVPAWRASRLDPNAALRAQ